jgi:hypothetical protein
MAVIPRLRELSQEDHEFEASLGYTVRPYLRIKNGKKNFTNIIKSIHILWQKKIVSMVHIDTEKVVFQIPHWARHGGIHLEPKYSLGGEWRIQCSNPV